MTWTRVSDDYFDRPEIYRLSRDARLLNIEAMVWCNHLLSDGFLERAALRRVTDAPDVASLIAELEGAGLWVPMDDRGWQLDWSDQEQAEAVRDRKEANAARSKRTRARAAAHGKGNHSMCDPRFCRHAVPRGAPRDVPRNAPGDDRTPVPSRPVPSQRERDGKVKRATAAGKAAPAVPALPRELWPPWCGACDEQTRLRTDADGPVSRCTNCHPLGSARTA